MPTAAITIRWWPSTTSGEIADAVDKVHLVPFGEYLPFADLLDRFGLEQIVAGPMNFAAGNERHADHAARRHPCDTVYLL